MITLYRRIERPQFFLVAFFLTGYLVIIWMGLSNYFSILSLNYLLGILAIGFCWSRAEKKNIITVNVVFALLGILFYSHLPSKFVLYLAISLCIFSFTEGMVGKPGTLAVICIFLMSPLFEYFTNVFGFPIRLELTKLAGSILNCFDSGFHTEGNMLVKGAQEYGVDPACIGLHMLNSSLLTGMIQVGIFQRRLGKKISLPGLGILLSGVFILNIFSNLIRIICLVEFHIPPENKLHGATGLGCFLIYVLVPTVFIARWSVNRFSKSYAWKNSTSEPGIPQWSLHLFLLAMLFLTVPKGGEKSMTSDISVGAVQMAGYKMEKLPDQIVKLSAPKGLVYLKPIFAFYSPDHQPSLCWKGSGFEFMTLEKCSVDGQIFYTSWLQKGKGRLLTAWWYDNGFTTTISQFEWRWDALKKGRRWALVNVTAGSKAELFRQIKEVRKANPCRMLLNPSK